MTELDFANAFLGEYKINGNEIVPLYCPFCHGGDRRDKYTFALSMENHTYNCKRASCGEKGHFKQLCDKYNVKAEMPNTQYRPIERRQYKKPTTPITSISQQGLDYLKLRGITPETAALYGITSDDKGNLVFPYYRTKEDFDNKQPTFVKFRPARKVEKGEAKMWREANTEPILFGLHLCDPSKKILYICEGEFDCMTFRQCTGGALNVVSVPSGAEDFTWVESCADELDQYGIIAVIGDADAAGQKMAFDIDHKFPDKKVRLPDYSKYRGCKDMNELAYRHGVAAVAEVVRSLKERPVEGLINISDIVPVDYTQIGRVLTGIKPLDMLIGGLYDGDLSILTGKRGEGKSAITNQWTISAVNQGVNVCVYSGEIPKDRFKYLLMLPAAGYLNIDAVPDPKTGRENYIIQPEKIPEIEKWLDGKVWIYDNDQIETDERENIFRLFTAAFRRYDCRLFIVDNLMTVNMGARANEVLQTQADFVIRLKKFASMFGVHVICVAHPRKGDGHIDDSDDVSGLSKITDIACNVFSIHKCDEKKQEELKCDAFLRVHKNRAYGDCKSIKLLFEKRSRRFSPPFIESEHLSWEKKGSENA
ncbi:MAG: DnaB-like helicase C-terminal domain-containing protein [Bacillota bacterium]|jgi:hypothetical protein